MKSNKIFAVKKVETGSDGMLQRLAAEIDVLKHLRHPNLTPVADIVDKGDSFIIVMEEVEGITLNELMEKGGVCAHDTVIEWMKQLCRAVGYLHAQQPPIFCGSINPANVIVKPDGRVSLLDFCILTETEDKEHHLPADGTDERTDIYYLGAMLYYLLTGCDPSEDYSKMKLISPLIPEGLKKIFIKSTQEDPAERYQSVDQMLRALKRCSNSGDKPRTLQLLKESILKKRRPASRREQVASTADTTAAVVPTSPAAPAASATPGLSASPGLSESPGSPASPAAPGLSESPATSAAPGLSASPALSQDGSVKVSQVSFSAVVPKRFIKGEYAMIEISVYEEMFRNVVDRIIANADTEVKEVVGGIQDVEAGTMIRIKLSSSDIDLPDCEETQRWSGKYLIFDFPVEVPGDYAKKQIQFTASVYFNDIIATKLKFIANCTSLREQKLEVIREDVLTAFMSYASQDRAEVATIIQGMKKIRPDLDVFFDVDNLRSGEYWETALRSEIEKRDILFLCWSKFAKESEWVEKEWKYALQNKGIDSIEPVSLISPSECPPPEELKSKHFNDRALLYKKM